MVNRVANLEGSNALGSSPGLHVLPLPFAQLLVLLERLDKVEDGVICGETAGLEVGPAGCDGVLVA